ncbi:MAG: hypothetical protein WDW38_004678 [Sanguina aurantia]
MRRPWRSCRHPHPRRHQRPRFRPTHPRRRRWGRSCQASPAAQTHCTAPCPTRHRSPTQPPAVAASPPLPSQPAPAAAAAAAAAEVASPAVLAGAALAHQTPWPPLIQSRPLPSQPRRPPLPLAWASPQHPPQRERQRRMATPHRPSNHSRLHLRGPLCRHALRPLHTQAHAIQEPAGSAASSSTSHTSTRRVAPSSTPPHGAPLPTLAPLNVNDARLIDFNTHSPFGRASTTPSTHAAPAQTSAPPPLTTSLAASPAFLRHSLPVTDAPEIDFFSPNAAASLSSPQLNQHGSGLQPSHTHSPPGAALLPRVPVNIANTGQPRGANSPRSNLLRSSLAGIVVPEDDYLRRSSPSMTGGSRDDVLPHALQDRVRIQALQLAHGGTLHTSPPESAGSFPALGSTGDRDGYVRRGETAREQQQQQYGSLHGGADSSSGGMGPGVAPALPDHLAGTGGGGAGSGAPSSAHSLTGPPSSSRLSRRGHHDPGDVAAAARADLDPSPHEASSCGYGPAAKGPRAPGALVIRQGPTEPPPLSTSSDSRVIAGREGGGEEQHSQPPSPSHAAGVDASGSILGMPRHSPKPGAPPSSGAGSLPTSLSFGRTNKPLASLAGLGLGGDMDFDTGGTTRHSTNSSSNIHASTQSMTIHKTSSAKALANGKALAEAQAQKQLQRQQMLQQMPPPSPPLQQGQWQPPSQAHQHPQQDHLQDQQQRSAHGNAQQQQQQGFFDGDSADPSSKDKQRSGGIGSVFASAIRRLSIPSGPDSGQGKATPSTAAPGKQKDPAAGISSASSFKALPPKARLMLRVNIKSLLPGGVASPDQARPVLRATASARVASTSTKDPPNLDPGGRSSNPRQGAAAAVRGFGIQGSSSMQSQTRAMTKAMSTGADDDFRTSSDEEPVVSTGRYQPSATAMRSSITSLSNSRSLMQAGSIKRVNSSDDEFD